MSEQRSDTPGGEGHGVYGGTDRDDARMQEEPVGSDEADDEAAWAEQTETGGTAAS